MIYSNLNRTGQIKEVKAKNNKEILEIYGGIGENNPIYYKETSLEGIVPLNFKALGQPITDWSIAGAQGGVGDKTENLFDEKYQFGFYAFADGVYAYATNWVCSERLFPCDPETKYTLKISMIRSNPSRWWGVVWYDSNKYFISATNFQPDTPQADITSVMESPPGARYFAINVASRINRPDAIVPSDVLQTMMNVGDTPMPYEQYGYRIPLTCGGETTNFYLDSPLSENDLISFLETHQRIPTITGQNTISINTAVQPSKIVIKGNIKT